MLDEPEEEPRANDDDDHVSPPLLNEEEEDVSGFRFFHKSSASGESIDGGSNQ